MKVANHKSRQWDTVDRVVGSREDITGAGKRALCVECQRPVFTSDGTPDDVPVICNVCFGNIPDSEILKDVPADIEFASAAQLIRLLQIYDVHPPHTTLSELQKKARRRGVSVKVVARDEIVAAVKQAMRKSSGGK
ncbi:hypothetical protein GCM10023321_26010 [Pseudonocardia eucalypti]|uniref:Uncharacterized protein n=1 Tax=Pseudonocardia eucalypti TaxID=648755 RepID=A0ABP9Q5I6_9PSEU